MALDILSSKINQKNHEKSIKNGQKACKYANFRAGQYVLVRFLLISNQFLSVRLKEIQLSQNYVH